MNPELKISEGVAVLAVSGEMDAYTAPQVRDELAEALQGDVRWVLADLTQTEFIDSLFLGILVGVGKRAGEKDGDIVIVCDRAHLLRVFDVSGTRELLNVVATREQAEELIAGWKRGCQGEGGAGREEEP